MILDGYINPTILEWGVNVLAFSNPSQDATRGVLFSHVGIRPLFNNESRPSIFTSQAKQPLFGDSQL